MDLLKRTAAVVAIATAMTSFIFLLVYSLAGVGPDELSSEDAFLILFVWTGSLILGIYGTYTHPAAYDTDTFTDNATTAE